MSSAAEFLPSSRSLKALAGAAEGCRGCEPYEDATPVTKERGRPLESPHAPVAAVTIHPSAIPPLSDRDEREAGLAGFVADLREAGLAGFVADLEAVATGLQGAAR